MDDGIPCKPEEDELYFVFSFNGKNPYIIQLLVNNQRCDFEIDTGSGRTIMSENNYHKYFNDVPLIRTNITLKTYSGVPLKIVGKINVVIRHNADAVDAEILVITGQGPTLLGRDILSKLKLNWSTVYKTETGKTITPDTGLPETLNSKYRQLFSDKIGKLDGFTAKIHVRNDATPKFCYSRKVPFALEDAVKLELQRLEEDEILKSVSYSDWASPIVIVPKADGQIRICGDFKKTINPFIETEQYPMPNPDELFQKMQGGQTFSKLDLKTAYLQMELDEESRKYLVINTPDGLKQYTRMPYGITSGPAIFQRKLENELKAINMTVVNIDDILVSGKNEAEHLSNLTDVLDKLTELGLTLNVKKCKFFQQSVEYVGFILNKNGIQTNPEKIKAVVEAPEPKTVHELQSFLGALNYYGKFIEHKSTIAAPLYSLLQGDTKWHWGETERNAFASLKQTLTEAPLLCLYNKQLPITLACDASSYGIGAVLSHVYPDKSEKPIAFASRKLNKSEINYSQLDKEALSVIFGVNKFHQYLFGRKFTLVTDNKALSYLFNRNASIPPLAASRLVRWALTLAAYDYDVEFKLTRDNYNADMLSRLPLADDTESYSVNAINTLQLGCMPISLVQMQKATMEDNVLSKVVNYLSTGNWPNGNIIEQNLKPYFNKRNELSLQDGVVLFGLRVVVPTIYRGIILTELHKCHPGIIRMKGLSRIHVWYPGIDADIETTVKSCYECAKNKNKPMKAFIHPWSWPTHPFDRVHIDFFELHGKEYLLLVDSYSKWLEIECLTKTKSCDTIRVLHRWFARFGFPIQLVSDNGPQFVSYEFDYFLKTHGIKHIRSSAYHPCSNGGAERFVQTVKQGLKACYIEKGDSNTKLNDYLFGYRITPSSVTGKTPSELFLGRQIRSRFDLMKPINKCDLADSDSSDASALKTKMDNYTEQMQTRTDGRSNVRSFLPHEKVLVANHIGKSKWLFGQIVRKISDRTYVVRIGRRDFKRHIDDIIRDDSSPVSDTIDDSWMYHDPTAQMLVPNRPRFMTPRRYPTRQRRPVDRYGMSNCV